MKQISRALIVLTCFAGGVVTTTAMATAQMSTAAKVQRFDNAELCYLDVAANEKDALLVREELQSRNVSCTPELRTEGKVALQQSVKLANFRTASQSLRNTNADRENRDKREVNRWIRCSPGNTQMNPPANCQ